MPGTISPRTFVGPDLSQWSLWWEYNRAPYLNLKSAVFAGGPITGDDAIGRDKPNASLRPSNQQVRGRVVPALLKALAEETHNDIVTGALVALAKIGGDATFLEAFSKQLASPNQEIAETAALAIGILGLPQGRTTLEHLAADDEEGRKLVGGNKEIPFRTRAFAVYGLGLIGHETNDANVRAACSVVIRDTLSTDRSSYKDLRVACILALGLIPDEAGLSIEALRGILLDNKNDKILRAHCPRSMANLVDRTHPLRNSVVKDFRKLLEDRKEKDFVRQSLVYGLGLLVHPGDEDYEGTVKTIEDAVLESRDEQERNFALIALARMGGPEAQSFLIKQMQKPRVAATKPWAAIALGVLGHASAKAGGVSDAILAQTIQTKFSEEKNPGNLGAYAVALGMLRDASSRDLLLQSLRVVRDEETQGYICLALGMIGARDSIEEIRRLAKESKNKPQLLYQATVALGLLGDKAMLPEMLEMLHGAKTLGLRSAVVSAMGYIGDQRSVDPLVENLANKKFQPIERGLSASALGLICDKEMLPWNSKISVDLNYRAAVTTLSDKAGSTGIVDIL